MHGYNYNDTAFTLITTRQLVSGYITLLFLFDHITQTVIIIVISNIILVLFAQSFVYHINLEVHPTCRDVTRANLVICSPCFLWPPSIIMLLPQLFICSLLQVYLVRSCLCIAIRAGGWHTLWLVLYSSYPCLNAAFSLISSNILYIIRILEGSRIISHSPGV